MNVVTAVVVLGTGMMVYSETHTLTYIYTALSKPVGLPGIHNFTAITLLDDRMIDYYDSLTQKKVPKQDWMEERLSEEYWEKGTARKKQKQLWFRDNLEILMERTGHNDSGVHVLQWRHGCVGEKQPNGSLTFLRGMHMYSYDGNDFLSYDDANDVWVAPSMAAQPTKRKYDNVQVQNEYIRRFLRNDCMRSLSMFLEYGRKQLENAKPPTVLLFAKNSNIQTNIVLTCLATGFFYKDMDLQIKMDGRVLTQDDGVTTSGALPDGDDTFLRRDSVEIFRDSVGTFTCHASHEASNQTAESTWDNVLPPEEDSGSVLLIVGGTVGVLLLLAGLIVGAVVGFQRWRRLLLKSSLQT